MSDTEVAIRYRTYGGLMGRVVAVITAIMSLYHILYITSVLLALGLYIPTGMHNAISLMFILSVTYLLVPVSSKVVRDFSKLPWYDVIFLVMGVMGTVYYAWNYKNMVLIGNLPTLAEQVIGIMLMVSILEGTRRSIGWVMAVLAVFFLFHAFYADLFPGFMAARGYSILRVTSNIYLSGNGIFGLAISVASTTIVAFIIFGSFLNNTGAGASLINMAFSAFGRLRGGPAKAAVFASGLMGSISGSAVGNVATTGVLTIPMMIKVGYRPHVAGAIEAVSSTGGQLMPPVMGAAAFIMAEVLQIPYWTIVAAALSPALLYYIAEFLFVDLEAAKNGMQGLKKEEVLPIATALKQGALYLTPITLLLYLIGGLSYRPETALFYSLGLTLIIAFVYRSINITNVAKVSVTSLQGSSVSMIEVGNACAAAGIIIGSLNLTGIGPALSGELVDIARGNSFALLGLAAFASYILGMGLGTTPAYIVVSVMVAPALIQEGILPLAAHLFVFYWAMTSMITPPVALAAFAGASIAGADPFKTGFAAMRIGMVALIIPFYFVYRPGLLMIGSWQEIVLAIGIALLGCVFLVVTATGYCFRKLFNYERLIFGAAATMFLIPLAIWDLIGTLLGFFGIACLCIRRDQNKPLVLPSTETQ